MEVELRKSLARSAQYLAEASDVTPGGAPDGKWWKPNLIYVDKAKGAYITDLDGNCYLDYHAASGSIFLGYNDSEVDDAVIDVIRNHGHQFALPHRFEIELARKLRSHIPCAEMSAFSNAGTDTAQFAVRAARAYTGRSKILKFEGGYHGWSDVVAVSTYPPRGAIGTDELPNAVPATAGLPREILDNYIVRSYNDLDGTADAVEKGKNEIAAIIVEPHIHGANISPAPGFLRGLRELCDATGVLLIFDEIVTGFRHGLGGLQAIEGVTPDLAIFGKAMANGYPISALVGRAEYMRALHPVGRALLSGTYNGNPMASAAALKTIEVLERPGTYERVYALGERLRAAIGGAIERLGLRACCTGYGSVWYLHFERQGPRNWRDVLAYEDTGARQKEHAYRTHMLNNDIFMFPVRGTRAYLTLAHTEADVQRTADVTIAFLTEHQTALR